MVFQVDWYMDSMNHITDVTLDYITPWFLWTLIGIHIALALTFIGIVQVNPQYIERFSILMRYFVCIFLLIRFHPFRKHILHKYDGRIIFIAAMFLLTNEGIANYLMAFYHSHNPNDIIQQII